MNRRQWLGVLGGIVGAGCLTAGPTGTETPPANSLERIDCPPAKAFRESRSVIDAVRCLREDQPTAGVRWSATKQRLASPRDSTTFTLTNDSDSKLKINPAAWVVSHLTDDGWKRVAPEQQVVPLALVEPGDQYSWELTLGTAVDTTTTGLPSEPPRVRVDGPGVYLFSVVGSQETTVVYAGLLSFQ